MNGMGMTFNKPAKATITVLYLLIFSALLLYVPDLLDGELIATLVVPLAAGLITLVVWVFTGKRLDRS